MFRLKTPPPKTLPSARYTCCNNIILSCIHFTTYKLDATYPSAVSRLAWSREIFGGGGGIPSSVGRYYRDRSKDSAGAWVGRNNRGDELNGTKISSRNDVLRGRCCVIL